MLYLSVRSDPNWSGRIEFDFPRYREFMGFSKDWPRMNTLSEWSTVERDRVYRVRRVGKGGSIFSGQQLREGWALEVTAGEDVPVTIELM